MSDTPRLGLPLLAAAQAQKHTTHNDALMALDALVQLSVLDRGRAVAPPEPAEGARHIVGPGAGGDWTGRTGDIAVRLDGGWRFFAPRTGWIAYVEDEGRPVRWTGAAWTTDTGLFDRLGVNAAPDAANRIVAALAAALFTDEGAGLQVKLNKTRVADTAAFLFQTAFGGRAEFGLIGGDNVALKVSPDGATWTTALTVDRTSGAVSGPAIAATTVGGRSAADLDARYMRRDGASAATAPLRLRVYTLATLPSAASAGLGALVAVSDGTANKRLAVSDGTAWRWPDGAVVS